MKKKIGGKKQELSVITQEQAEAPENALAAIGAEAVKPLIEAYKKSDHSPKRRILTIFKKMGPKAKPALPFLTQEYITETSGVLQIGLDESLDSILKEDDVERQRFLIKLIESRKKYRMRQELNKSLKEKKKAQGRFPDGVESN